jgi:hypothetical protein
MAKSATRMRFDRAYKEARDNGEKTFDFEGKSYNTRMAGEGSSAYGKSMASGGRNKARSGEDSAGGEEIRSAGQANTVESEDMSTGSDMAASAARNGTRGINQPDVVTGPKTGIVPRRYGTYRTGENDTTESKPFFTLNSDMPQRRYGTVGKVQESTAPEASSPDLVPDIYKGERQVPDQQYRKGGMVKKKSGGMMKKKSGGAVRGAGIAQRGQGKMRMC